MKSSTQLLLVISAVLAAGMTATIARAADTPSASSDEAALLRDRTPPPEVMAIYDVDQNGTLDEDERAVLREDIASGTFVPPGRQDGMRGPHGPGPRRLPPDLIARYDANNDGTLDDAERAALRADVAAGKVEIPPRGPRLRRQPPPEIVAQYDTNKDGKLDEAERAALHADIQSGKIAPPRHPDARGPGPHLGPPDAPPPPDGRTASTL
jgi:hypothetical protein